MSEEKLYAVKNDEGKYWNFADRDGFFESDFASCSATDDERYTKNVVRDHGGHVVALVEEPEKVVLTKEQAEIVEEANDYPYPARHILDYADYSSGVGEKLLMNAYVNGYTVAKEKKYNVKVPHVSLYYWKTPDGGLGIDDLNVITADYDTDDFEFTESEIEHYGLQDCEKEEVTDDDE